MPYPARRHLEAALEILSKDWHPVLTTVLALLDARVPRHPDSSTFGARQEREVMRRLFSIEGGSRPYFMPLGEPRGTRAAISYWRDDNYPGRTLQVMRKDAARAGALVQDGTREWALPEGDERFLKWLREDKGVSLPVPLAALAVWALRDRDVDELAELTPLLVDELHLREGAGESLFDALFTTKMPEELEAVEDVALAEDPLSEVEMLEWLGDGSMEEQGGDVDGHDRPDHGGRNPDGLRELDAPVQQLLHGCPGSGKSFQLARAARQAHHVVRTAFHPETSYAEFVGTLRPMSAFAADGGGGRSFVAASGQGLVLPGEPYVYYTFVPGPLITAYALACANPNDSVVLIIEELSRANPARVFGDVLQLLDRLDEGEGGLPAGTSRYAIQPEPALKHYLGEHDITHADVASGCLRLPSNLYLWATMNRADQNARQLDTAFLRRWRKRHLSADADCTYDRPVSYGGSEISWDRLRRHINRKLVEARVPEDKLIGPYFLSASVLASEEGFFDDLFGYLWNDVLKPTRAPDFFEGQHHTLGRLHRAWAKGTPIVGHPDDSA